MSIQSVLLNAPETESVSDVALALEILDLENITGEQKVTYEQIVNMLAMIQSYRPHIIPILIQLDSLTNPD
jgi:hypothetical protein